VQSRRGVRRRSAGARRRHRDVLRSHRSARRHPSADAARRHSGRGPPVDPRNAWYDDYLAAGASDRAANTTPGNQRGGLANIVEKALGSIAKAGSTAIQAVASHGEKVTAKGLVFAATPASDFICGTQQLASMNLHVFTTGEGSPYGLALVPVVKVSSRTALAEKWHDLIDIDAGRIATGQATIEEVGWEIVPLHSRSGQRPQDVGGEHALSPFNGIGWRIKALAESPIELRSRIRSGQLPVTNTGAALARFGRR
jgi:hypothetical protein